MIQQPMFGDFKDESSPHPMPVNNKSLIILLDLNYTLVANSELKKRQGAMPYVAKINFETYREWLIDLIKGCTTLLCTVRGNMYLAPTMNRIKAQTGWQPDKVYFNPTPEIFRGEIVKEKYLLTSIFPNYGYPIDYPSRETGALGNTRYLAIESATATRQMYKRYRIKAVPQEQCREGLPI